MLIAVERIESKIFHIRGKKVMLDSDLAGLYGVSTKRLNEQVKRNKKRFPEDFMFQLTKEEAMNLKPHFATSRWGGHRYLSLRSQNATSKKGGRRYLPHVFTEQGVSMLSSVLNSERAIQVNISIMRAFVNLRRIALTYTGLKRKIEAMENKYDAQFKVVFEAIKALLSPVSMKEQKVIKGFRR